MIPPQLGSNGREPPVISQKHLDWIIQELAHIQKSLPDNSYLEKDLGILINRFKTEFLDSSSPSFQLSQSSQKKFSRILDDLTTIWNRETIQYNEFSSHINRHDHHIMLQMLEALLNDAKNISPFSQL
jgi:hypothetical protein